MDGPASRRGRRRVDRDDTSTPRSTGCCAGPGLIHSVTAGGRLRARRLPMKWTACLGFIGLTVVAADSAVAQLPVAIVGGTLIDGRGGEPLRDAVVVVTGDRITAVGPAATTPVPPGARVIRAEGKTVLPGLIDAH